MPDKIIFLDIDGPMIPYTEYLFVKHASFRQILDKKCVEVLHKIVESSGAKIVFNTTHNTLLYSDDKGRRYKYDTPGLLQRFYEEGFEEHIHHTICTDYPNVSRLKAIEGWLEKNRTDNMLWVALDEEKIDHKRAFLVDPNHGIGIDAYNFCAKYLVYSPFLVL